MKKRICALVLLIALPVFLIGCDLLGNSDSATSTVSGVQLLGKKTGGTTKSLGKALGKLTSNDGKNLGDPNYTDKLVTPGYYSVGLIKAELLNADESQSFTIIDKGSASNAEHFDLSDTPQAITTNTNYPAAGTYTKMRITLAYLQMKINTVIPPATTPSPYEFRLYTSTVGDNQDGDLKIYIGGLWGWIDNDTGNFVSGRPKNPLQDPFFASDITESPDPFVITITFSSSVTIPANPSGLYKFYLTFDITDTFFYDDVDNDGLFEPGFKGDDTNGVFYPGPPEITVTFSTE